MHLFVNPFIQQKTILKTFLENRVSQWERRNASEIDLTSLPKDVFDAIKIDQFELSKNLCFEHIANVLEPIEKLEKGYQKKIKLLVKQHQSSNDTLQVSLLVEMVNRLINNGVLLPFTKNAVIGLNRFVTKMKMVMQNSFFRPRMCIIL